MVVELESGPVARNKITESINAVADEELQLFLEKLYKFSIQRTSIHVFSCQIHNYDRICTN